MSVKLKKVYTAPAISDTYALKDLKDMSISDIIKRDASEKVVRNVPEFEDATVTWWNRWIKFMNIEKVI